MTAKTLAAALAACSLAAPALADVLYVQTFGNTGTLLPAAYWDPDGSDFDAISWDGFVLPAGANVTQIKWRGGYPANVPNITYFDLAICPSIPAGIQPDVVAAPLWHTNVAGRCAETLIGNFGGVNIYEYTYNLRTPLTLPSSTRYWFRIQAWQPSWPSWGVATGTGGNGTYFTREIGMGDYRFLYRTGDFAMSINGTWNNCSNPTITQDPAPVSVCFGGASATFSCAATGTGPFTYRWRLNGNPVYDGPNGGGHGGGATISGATTPTLSIVSPSYWADVGNYDCVVTNACGPTATAAVPLYVAFGGPTISQQPAHASTCTSGNASFTVAASGGGAGGGPLAYEWQVLRHGQWASLADGPLTDTDGAVLATVSGSAEATLSLALQPAMASHAAGFTGYRCRIGNPCSTVTSSPATLSLCVADFNCDAFVDFFDYDAFVAAFEVGDPAADVNGDAFLDFFDYDQFVSVFEAGC